MAKQSVCTFCKIINGSAPGFSVFEDEISMAFLDIRPLFPGHCLLVPKIHYETLNDLPVDLVAPLFTNARFLTRAVQEACTSEGTFVAMNNTVSQSVPHLHIHIVPRNRKDGLKGFFWPRNKYDGEEHIRSTQLKLIDKIQQLQNRLENGL